MAGNIDFGAIRDAFDAWIGETVSVIPAMSHAMAGRETATVLLAGGVLLGAIIGIRHRKRRRAENAPATDLAALTRGPKRLGVAAAGAFMLVFGGWSVYAPLASAALAPGVISPDGYRKTVQHLEGGIIRTIHVREGDEVAAGDPLITLDDTAARSLDAEIRERFLHMLAAEARLVAEQNGEDEIAFPPALHEENSPELRDIMASQRQLLASRKATLSTRTDILESRVLQLGEQNAGLEQVIVAQDEQLALVEEEIAGAESLLEQGYERKPKVLGLQRMRAEIAASRAMNTARIAENEQAIGEARLQLIAVQEERREEISTELANVRRILSELRGQMPSREDILERTVIRAPISGKVMNLRVTTEGGVVKPSEAVAEIVPTDAHLIVNARVQPNDIDRIVPGMTARVVLTAYNQRNLSIIHGRLQSISADALVDEHTGLAYFLARVEVDPEELANNANVQLLPGMPAEVMLLGGERSAFEYFLSPILDSRRRSFLEG